METGRFDIVFEKLQGAIMDDPGCDEDFSELIEETEEIAELKRFAEALSNPVDIETQTVTRL